MLWDANRHPERDLDVQKPATWHQGSKARWERKRQSEKKGTLCTSTYVMKTVLKVLVNVLRCRLGLVQVISAPKP